MTTKETAFKKISELVERFGEQIESYKHSDYNETLTRRDFIDPFFKALGWDIDNENGYAESYREVIHEDKIKIGVATKAPDYSFRLVGGKRLFFVEAKKPSVDVKGDIQPAYQVRRYGWSAKLSISIITDFEEFAVYDCTKRPKPTDKSSVARIKYLTFREYLDQFDFIWDTFSKERVLKGSFDKYVLSDTNKKGTATVDKEFLLSLDSWRTVLAENISLNNKQLDEEELNFAVQQIIDRIIFLRIAEDRNIEPYGNLKISLQKGDYYKNLFNLFIKANEKYNSGLFDFTKDKISQRLKIDNSVLKTIFNELYYPESPYEFSVLSVEILGSAYEQFLGKQITVDSSNKAQIEEKPEVRKAGGVYYTPQYIVDYIVQQTIGKLIDGKTPKEIAKIKIVDPACGSGSFLIGAYQYLLDFHKNYYSDNGKPSKGKKDNPLTPEGNLTTSEKKRILLNHIYGVDIDVNAVEVTKLSLLLKCMEGETDASISAQFKMFHERVLPTLDNNIKSGNSLIDTDFYDNEFDFGEEKKIKPFNWQKAFPEVFNRKVESPEDDLKEIAKKAKQHAEKALGYVTELEEKLQTAKEPSVHYQVKGGFDVVIGNPPYGAGFNISEKEYLLAKYQNQNYQLDSYLIFLEQSIKTLLKSNGVFGMIIPNPWLTNLLQKKLRRFVFENTCVNEIVHFNQKVFRSVTVDTEIVLLTNKRPKNNVTKITLVEKGKSLLNYKHSIIFHKQDGWISAKGEVINIFQSERDKTLIQKIINESSNLEEHFFINVGIKPYQVGKGKPKQTKEDVEKRVFDSHKKENKYYRKYLRGSDINRYKTEPLEVRYIKYGDWLAEPRPSANFDAVTKIFIRQTGDSLVGTIDNEQYLCLNNLHVLVPKNDSDIKTNYFLGIINSRLLNWYYQTLNPEKGEALAEVKKGNVASLPIKVSKNKIHDEIVKYVDLLLKLNQELHEAKLDSKIEQIKSRIEHSEDKINQLVYQLYELTPEEIAIVEGK